MKYAAHEVSSGEDWNNKLSEFDYYHFLQSWQWGELKAKNGWQAYRFEVKDKNKTVALFQLLTRPIHPKIPIKVGYTPKGPTFSKVADQKQLLKLIESIGRDKGCAYVKVDPDIDETSPAGKKWMTALKKSGWVFSKEQIQTKNTGHTELIPDDNDGEEKLFANMSKRWRYNTRLATKRGITIRRGRPDDMQLFYELYRETGSRQSFGIRSLEYYNQVYKSFDGNRDTDSLLLLAEHPDEEQPLSAAFFLRFYDRVWYFYAASSDRRRPDMPNYILQWEAMKWARDTGAHHYDWGGAVTKLDDKHDPMARVWHFKKGFGATLFQSTGAWDKPISVLKWRLFRLAAKLQKTIRR